MNLYDFSQDNSIEVGVESVNSNIIKRSGLDAESWNYFNVIDSASVVFNREPKYKELMELTESYVGSETVIDEIDIPEISSSKQRSNEKKAKGKLLPQKVVRQSVLWRRSRSRRLRKKISRRWSFCIRSTANPFRSMSYAR